MSSDPIETRISDSTIREVEAMAKADRAYEKAQEHERAVWELFADKIVADALYLYACGLPLRKAIRGAAVQALEDWEDTK